MDIIIQFVLSVSWNILLVMFSTAKSSDSGKDIVGFGFFYRFVSVNMEVFPVYYCIFVYGGANASDMAGD